jgi:protein-S-isoprenylcysteine O-methyltransferase Ste14
MALDHERYPHRASVLLLGKSLLFALLAPGTVAGYLPWLITRGTPMGSTGYVLAATALFVAGGVIDLWCIWDFAILGRGTPAPIAAPRTLVAQGPYRYVRNPMYLGVLAILLGWALLYRALTLLLYALAVSAAFHAFVLLYEEPRLRKDFGEDYERCCVLVRRWIPAARSRPRDTAST